MRLTRTRTFTGAVALGLGLSLAACGGMPTERSLYSTNQPVVERENVTFDVSTGSGGMDVYEQQRLDGWFDAMDLRYGDRVSIDDPMANSATREAIGKLAARRGILVSDGSPMTTGFVEPGQARVVITRSTASVPDCPNWSAKSSANYNNAAHPNYGCAINSNFAAMVANPEDLIKGQEGTGETVVLSATKAIDTYREKAPTGTGGLTQNSTGGE